MLTSWRFKTAALLTLLVVVSVFTGAAHALESRTGHDNGISWYVAVGDFDWNSTDTYSWHEVFLNNTSDVLGTAYWGWWHTVVNVNTGQEMRWDKVTGGGDMSPGATVERSGWLNADISGLRNDRQYRIKGETYVRIHPPRKEDGASIRREVIDWSRRFWKD
ncbi:hypothetical protein F4X33_05405 [Candidatus Poribacteria bacterium]|nr:hypothetical protein [Candidatus Poribacteria bacterium]